MKIESLNKTEKKQIEMFQRAYFNIVKRSIRRRGFNDKALSDIRKGLKGLSRSMVDSAFALGLKWLNQESK